MDPGPGRQHVRPRERHLTSSGPTTEPRIPYAETAPACSRSTCPIAQPSGAAATSETDDGHARGSRGVHRGEGGGAFVEADDLADEVSRAERAVLDQADHRRVVAAGHAVR